MTIRIVKTEKFLPANGATVFQITEEITTDDGRIVRLDPRNPTPDELTDADDQFAARQQALIADLASQLKTMEAERDTLAEKLSANDLMHDPRMIDPSAWYGRLDMDHVLAITELAATDTVAAGFVAALKESRELRKADPSYQMSLDHPNAVQGIGYLASKGVFTADEAAAMLADSREDEA